jgi:hypothetical protein
MHDVSTADRFLTLTGCACKPFILEARLRFLKYLLSFIFVLVLSILAFSSFLIFNTALPDEAWLVSSAREMSQSFSLIPRLGGYILGNQNPLVIMIYSMAGGDLFVSRLGTAALGILMGLTVMFFAGYMWNLKTGVISSILTVTSLGIISIFGKADPSALPVMTSVISFMIFSAVYLRNLSRIIYIPAYILAVVSIITGGPVYLFFFLVSGVLLILLDLSPKELLKTKPVAAGILFAGGLIAVCAVYWLGGDWNYMKGALSQGTNLGFFNSLWLVFKNCLPWIFLLVPAWIYSARPAEFIMWRDLLPAKIAFSACLVILWLSGRCPESFSVLAAPFASIMIGNWVSGGGKAFEKSGKTGLVSFAATAIMVLLIPATYIMKFPFGSLHPGMFDAGIMLALAVCSSVIFYAALKKRYNVAIVLVVIAVSAMTWLSPYYETRLNNPSVILSYCANHKPLMVFDDDLVMRGNLSAVRPGVVGRCFVPVGGEAYIAASTKDAEKLLKDIRKSMSAELKARLDLDRAYLLIRVWPKRLS